MNNIDFTKLTAEWLIENFQEITDDVSNGDYIEDVTFEKNIASEYIRETFSIKEWEDGIKINFRVWFNRWGDFMTEKRLSYIKITNDGKISIRLPEALEGGEIEEYLEERIAKLLEIKQEEEVVLTTYLVPTKIYLDRDRRINYNGEEIMANNFKCSTCNNHFIMQVMPFDFCPCCGVEFKEMEDISI
jgi:hypothetical protein